jgi:hypothetical protein
VKFTKEMVKMLELFAQHKPLRAMYYAGLGVAYIFGTAVLIRALAVVFA